MTDTAKQASERYQAEHIANLILERPNADPDDDIAILARQFLRVIEREPETATLREEVEELAARVEALEKFVKRVKNHFDRHGVNSDGDLRLEKAARKLLETR